MLGLPEIYRSGAEANKRRTVQERESALHDFLVEYKFLRCANFIFRTREAYIFCRDSDDTSMSRLKIGRFISVCP